MIIVKPQTITDAILDVSGSPPATNVPETDYAAWSSGTTYAVGDRVILTSTHKIYESLQATNLNKNPVSEALWWLEVAPTNRWACFDTSVSTSTKQSTNITYKLLPGNAVNAIAAINLVNATQINISMFSPMIGTPGLVYSKTIDLSPLPTAPDWWSWFYGVRNAPTQAIEVDLPSYSDCEIEFELIGGADLSMGVLLIGQQRAFGVGIQYGARVGIQDYSRKETNDFGDTVLVRRAFAKRANFDLIASSGEVDSLQNFLAEVRAVPCLWVGSNQYESTTLFGFYKNFEILISYPEQSDCSLEIEGLT